MLGSRAIFTIFRTVAIMHRTCVCVRVHCALTFGRKANIQFWHTTAIKLTIVAFLYLLRLPIPFTPSLFFRSAIHISLLDNDARLGCTAHTHTTRRVSEKSALHGTNVKKSDKYCFAQIAPHTFQTHAYMRTSESSKSERLLLFRTEKEQKYCFQPKAQGHIQKQ